MRAGGLNSRFSRAASLLVVAVLAAAAVLLVTTSTQRADAAVAPGTTELISGGIHAHFKGSGQAAISADGRYVAFTTLKSYDLLDVHREGGSDLDVYVHDRRENKTVLLSHGVLIPPEAIFGTDALPNVLTVPANGHSGNPSISADGRYVAFETTATNLGPRDHDLKSDVVVVDRDPNGNGVFDEKHCPLLRLYCHEFTRVSPNRHDEQDNRVIRAMTPSISAAGDAVAWVGEVRTDSDSPHRGEPVVYRSTFDRGPTGAITVVRSDQVHPDAGEFTVRGATAPTLSGDGSRLAMVANLQVGSDDTAGDTAVLGVDLAAGPVAAGDRYPATRLDVDEDGGPLSLPAGFAATPALSGDGRLAAFTAPGAESSVVRTVRWEPGAQPRSSVVSRNLSGEPVHGMHPALSADGRYLAFTTSARATHNGVDGPETQCNPGRQLGLGLGLGVGLRIDVEASVEADTDPPGAEVGVDAEVEAEIVLGLGFGEPPPSQAPPDADPDADTASLCDVVVRDLVLDQARTDAELPMLPAELASASLARNCAPDLAPDKTCAGNGASGFPALSADGGVVAFESFATTLVADDRHGHKQNVFARVFQPALTGDPIDFFTIEPGTSTLGSTVLRHQGFGPLPVQSMTIRGQHAAEFTVNAQTCIGQVLQAGDTCLVSVRFAPTDLGPREAALEVHYRGGRSPLIVPLIGNAARPAPPAFGLAPDPLDFGAHLPLSTNPPGTVTATNTGSAPLTIAAVAIPADAGSENFPEDYRISADTCAGVTLQPGANCTVTVLHSPQGVGERPAVLQFDSNAPNAPHLVALRGSGIQPELRIDPAVVRDGRVTTVIGSGFAPDRAVTVRVPELPSPIRVTADGAGNFTATVVIFPNSTPGERLVAATIDGHQPLITATATILIVPGTLSPPDFLNRG